MEPETDDESDEATEQASLEQKEETPPQFKLRDLRPEKDPIGAGGKRSPRAGATHFLR